MEIRKSNETDAEYQERLAAALNTDREIWRGPDEGTGAFYADSVHVTKEGGIGINCGGSVIVRLLRDWHALAQSDLEREKINQEWVGEYVDLRNKIRALLSDVAQILDVVKIEWSAENSWSEWDQSVRDRITEVAKQVASPQETVRE